jgi:LuxR family transcriptional regulator, maltose regulon positive regulatory protein
MYTMTLEAWPNSYIPKALKFEISRAALLKKLEAAKGCCLVSLIAPAGYGKTTLLAQHLRSSEKPTLWITLSSDEADPLRLAAHLLEELSDSFPDFVARSWDKALALQSPSDSLARALAKDLNTLPSFRLVLDKTEYLEVGTCKWLERLVLSLADQHQILTAGYRLEGFPLSRFIAEGKAMALEIADLALDTAETQELFVNLGSSRSSLEAHTQFEGWAAALALSALSQSQTFQAKDLIRERLSLLPSQLQPLRSSLAVLDVWSPHTLTEFGLDFPHSGLSEVLALGLPMTPLG